MVDRTHVEPWYRQLQDELCGTIEQLDSEAVFSSELWQRPGGGGGDTRILAGRTIEKAAVNFSAVWGKSPPSLRERGAGDEFFATGVSMIVHPASPHIPTFHANLRYFQTDVTAWFGGGADLTPYYLDATHIENFHHSLRAVCDRHAIADYVTWKQACDDYFYLPHRGEARGAGGIFFDHLDDDLDETWSFQQDLGRTLMTPFVPMVDAGASVDVTAEQRNWQLHRRGRYVEFNLAWDRGTKFGLETGGRAESILASLPPAATWKPHAEPAPGTPEHDWMSFVAGQPRAWA